MNHKVTWGSEVRRKKLKGDKDQGGGESFLGYLRKYLEASVAEAKG